MSEEVKKRVSEVVNEFSEKTAILTKCFEVQGHKLWVSPSLLAQHSEVFKAMFYGNFAEKDQESVELPEKSHDEILDLLRCLVPHPLLKSVGDENFKSVLKLANEYQIPVLTKQCDEFLWKKFERTALGYPQLVQQLKLLSEYNIQRLKELMTLKAAQSSFGDLERLMSNKEIDPCIRFAVAKAKFRQLNADVVPSRHHFRSNRERSIKCDSCKVTIDAGDYCYVLPLVNKSFCCSCFDPVTKVIAPKCSSCNKKFNEYNGEVKCQCNLKIDKKILSGDY